MAAEVGHLELAYDYFAEAALMDLDDLEHNTRDGVHIASLAGAWIAAVAGFGGMRDHDGELSFAPRLPDAHPAARLPARLPGPAAAGRGDPGAGSLLPARGQPLEIHHHGKAGTITEKADLVLEIPPAPPRQPAAQPPGREPLTRGRRRRH